MPEKASLPFQPSYAALVRSPHAWNLTSDPCLAGDGDDEKAEEVTIYYCTAVYGTRTYKRRQAQGVRSWNWHSQQVPTSLVNKDHQRSVLDLLACLTQSKNDCKTVLSLNCSLFRVNSAFRRGP